MEFTMMRDKVVVGLVGHAVEFKKGVPTYVVPQMWDTVIAAGAVPNEELPQPEAPKVDVLQGIEREQAIVEAMKKMVLRAQREDFNAKGYPQPAVISQLVGFPVDAKERDRVWQVLQQADKDPE